MLRIFIFLLMLIGVAISYNPVVEQLDAISLNVYYPSEAFINISSNVGCVYQKQSIYRFNSTSDTNYTHLYCTVKYHGTIDIQTPYAVVLSPLNYSGTFGSDVFYKYTYAFDGMTYDLNINAIYYTRDEDEPVWSIIVIPTRVHPGFTSLRILPELEIRYNTHTI